MKPHEAIEAARLARRRIRVVAGALTHPTPEILDRCGVDLAAAIGHLQAVNSGLPVAETSGGDGALAGVLADLRKDLGQISLLMHQAWEFQIGYNSAGYTEKGASAATVPATRWALEG